jgi:hypothetical protein
VFSSYIPDAKIVLAKLGNLCFRDRTVRDPQPPQSGHLAQRWITPRARVMTIHPVNLGVRFLDLSIV